MNTLFEGESTCVLFQTKHLGGSSVKNIVAAVALTSFCLIHFVVGVVHENIGIVVGCGITGVATAGKGSCVFVNLSFGCGYGERREQHEYEDKRHNNTK